MSNLLAAKSALGLDGGNKNNGAGGGGSLGSRGSSTLTPASSRTATASAAASSRTSASVAPTHHHQQQHQRGRQHDRSSFDTTRRDRSAASGRSGGSGSNTNHVGGGSSSSRHSSIRELSSMARSEARYNRSSAYGRSDATFDASAASGVRSSPGTATNSGPSLSARERLRNHPDYVSPDGDGTTTHRGSWGLSSFHTTGSAPRTITPSAAASRITPGAPPSHPGSSLTSHSRWLHATSVAPRISTDKSLAGTLEEDGSEMDSLFATRSSSAKGGGSGGAGRGELNNSGRSGAVILNNDSGHGNSVVRFNDEVDDDGRGGSATHRSSSHRTRSPSDGLRSSFYSASSKNNDSNGLGDSSTRFSSSNSSSRRRSSPFAKNSSFGSSGLASSSSYASRRQQEGFGLYSSSNFGENAYESKTPIVADRGTGGGTTTTTTTSSRRRAAVGRTSDMVIYEGAGGERDDGDDDDAANHTLSIDRHEASDSFFDRKEEEDHLDASASASSRLSIDRHEASDSFFDSGTVSASAASASVASSSRRSVCSEDDASRSHASGVSSRRSYDDDDDEGENDEGEDDSSYVPQRLDEMRALLSAITPLQLEALLLEIFDEAASVPRGWGSVAARSSSMSSMSFATLATTVSFRKDAYLGEMGLEELRRFAEGKGLADAEEWEDEEEAMDSIAVEFERLVSLRQNAEEEEGDDAGSSASMMSGSERSGAVALLDAASRASGSVATNGSDEEPSDVMRDEGANLRRSLRACSLPELRLVAERLALDHEGLAGSGNEKADLILMIESSMPEMSQEGTMTTGSGECGGMMQGEESVGSFGAPHQQDDYLLLEGGRPMTEEEEYFHQQQQQQHNGQQLQLTDEKHDQGSFDYEDEWSNTDYARKVKFSTDCKQDLSHLTPQREKGGNWQAFVTSAEAEAAEQAAEAERGFGEEGHMPEGGRRRPDYDEEDFVDHARPLVKYRGGEMDDDGSSRGERRGGGGRRRRGRSNDEEPPRSKAALVWSRIPDMPFKGQRLKLLGALVVVGVAVGAGLYFTGDDDGPPADLVMPDPNDPFFVRNPYEGSGGGSNTNNTRMPSARPSDILGEEGEEEEDDEGDSASSEDESPIWASFGKRSPTSRPSPGSSPDVVVGGGDPPSLAAWAAKTPSPVTGAPVEIARTAFPVVIARTAFPTPRATAKPVVVTPSPTIPREVVVSVPPPPAPAPEPYPLLGPRVERSMRLALYGVPPPLSHMGRTQWRMLTAAYVEQFYNEEDREGADAVQNVVFDVSSDVEIEDVTELPRDRGGVGIVLTFAVTLRYRTYSANIAPSTIAERPFFDERIREGYVGFLVSNNAVAHMGDISGVSPIFFGDDLPEGPRSEPTHSPLFRLPQPEWQDVPEEEDVRVPDPTDRPTPRPTQRPTRQPTRQPSRYPTERPSNRPSRQPTNPPVTPAPTPRQETPEPTERPATSAPTPRPTDPPTPTPTPRPEEPEPAAETYYPTPTDLLNFAFPTLAPYLPPDDEDAETGRAYVPNEVSATAVSVVLEEEGATAASVAETEPTDPASEDFVAVGATAANVVARPHKKTNDPPRSKVVTDEGSAKTAYSNAATTTTQPTDPPRKRRTAPPTPRPSTDSPSSNPTSSPSTSPITDPPSSAPTLGPTGAPTEYCLSPVTNEPICPLLAELECCPPMCAWDGEAGRCSFAARDDGVVDHRPREEAEWLGTVEVGQTHVVRAVGETRHAPRVVAQREAEVLFVPAAGPPRGGLGGRKPSDGIHGKRSFSSPEEENKEERRRTRIGSLGTVYLVVGDRTRPKLDASAQRLLDGSGSVFTLPPEVPDLDLVVDLNAVRSIHEVSLTLHGDTILDGGAVRAALHYDDGKNQEENGDFRMPDADWTWHDTAASAAAVEEGSRGRKVTVAIAGGPVAARYVLLRLEGGRSASGGSRWGFERLEVGGSKDGLSPSEDGGVSQHHRDDGKFLKPAIRTFAGATTSARYFSPSNEASVRVAVYSPSGRLVGATTARDPSRQRGILERRLSPLEIPDYSESAWSATLPHSWVEEGNVVAIGCVVEDQDDAGRLGGELLVHRWEMTNLAQFSEHTITRTKLAIFGSASQAARLDTATHPARRLARNLHSVMTVAELKWVDTDLWHLPYIVVMGTDGPALVESEEERRAATGRGEEVSWSVLKNFLTIRHSLAATGQGLSMTSVDGANSPYASGTSVFMGWSLSKRGDADEDEWEWEDLGYWDNLAAAAWTGWCAMKAGDECSNYLVHEMGHAQTMQHFDQGTAEAWGIDDEYPLDGKHTSLHPWGYDGVSRQFRTWFDPFNGDGKLDPLNGAGEGPTSDQCYSQYTPYQAKKAQEWASRTPVLLSSESSDVPEDGAYRFDPATRAYSRLERTVLADAVGEAAMTPERVGAPVITLVGTIGREPAVCQTYPALRSRSGNAFELPDPFSPRLPSVFDGAAHFVEVRFHGGRVARGLIAVEADLAPTALKFFSFNIAIARRPTSVGLYRFTDASYPNLTPLSGTELLHLRPTELPLDDPLASLPPLMRVGRGWLGDSSDVVLDRFCTTRDECGSVDNIIEWRSDVGNNNVVYSSSLTPQAQGLLGATLFHVPAVREWDDSGTEYAIAILAKRVFNDRLGSMPLLATDPTSDDVGSSDIDGTHGISLVAPWEMNGSLPAGTYRSIPGAFKISAKPIGLGAGGRDDRPLVWINVSLNLGTITEPPTTSPTKKPSPGPSLSPVQVRYFIDWGLFTCVTDGESTEWAPAYVTKDECCHAHMGYDFAMCMRSE